MLEFHPKTSFTIISKGRVVNLRFDEITHVSKYSNEVAIYTRETSYRIYINLKEIMQDLPANDFFRIHKSHIISLKHMSGIKEKKIMVGEYRLPVSNHYKLRMKAHLKKILDEKYEGIIDPKLAKC